MLKNSIFLVLMSVALISCNGQSKETTQEGEATIIADVDVKTFAAYIASGEGVLLDVRTPGEYNSGHLANSTLIDFKGSGFKESLSELDKETPVYVYCRSGGRSGSAASMMHNMGFKAVYNLEGGILAWTAQGQPTE